MVRQGAFLHAEAGIESVGVRFGIAMPFAGRLVMAFGAKDKVEIGAYRVNGREVSGIWVPPGASDDDFARCGREESVVEAEGVWKIRRARAVDGSEYTGTVTLTPAAGMSFGNPPTPVKMSTGDNKIDGNDDCCGRLVSATPKTSLPLSISLDHV